MTELKKLREYPELKEQAASWFCQKWGIPYEAYEESIAQCVEKKTGVPQWYVIVNEKQEIIAGAGMIDNDFHDRKDLTPNLCALFVEEEYRKQGLARYLLDRIRLDMSSMGIRRIYLVTDHTEFYEKCGWQFLTMVNDEEDFQERMYTASTDLV